MRTRPNPNNEVLQRTPGGTNAGAGGIDRDRRRLCLGSAALLGLAACTTPPTRPPERAGAGVVPFSATRTLGGLPDGWAEQVMRRDLPRTAYTVVERDGRRVLQAVSDGGASGLRCDVDIDPQATPWLEWAWQVDRVEPGAAVAANDTDDSPARLMLAFDGDVSRLTLRDQMFQEMVQAVTGYTVPFATLIYVWDGQAPPESVFRNPRTDRARYLVVQCGGAGAGRWLGYRRNVVEDYRRVFGDEPGRIQGVGVMTDSDDLGTHSEAWYGDISLRRAP